MKVNVIGRGFVPGPNSIAPVYNQEMSENQIRRILNLGNLRVFDATTGGLITKRNINNIFSDKNKTAVNKEAVVNKTTNIDSSETNTTLEDVVPTTEENTDVPEVSETTLSEITEDMVTDEQESVITEETVEDVVEETAETEVDDTVVEDTIVEDVEEVSDETATTSEKPAYHNNNKNRNKNRHHR